MRARISSSEPAPKSRAAPGFDPNAFNYGLSSEAWQALLNDPKAPLINKSTGGQYPPGSTFKMVVALAALKAAVIEPGQTVFCPGCATKPRPSVVT